MSAQETYQGNTRSTGSAAAVLAAPPADVDSAEEDSKDGSGTEAEVAVAANQALAQAKLYGSVTLTAIEDENNEEIWILAPKVRMLATILQENPDLSALLHELRLDHDYIMLNTKRAAEVDDWLKASGMNPQALEWHDPDEDLEMVVQNKLFDDYEASPWAALQPTASSLHNCQSIEMVNVESTFVSLMTLTLDVSWLEDLYDDGKEYEAFGQVFKARGIEVTILQVAAG
ncbi:hypothetical protein JCM11641_001707 [Rhodosporidiobolus odoratus]